MIRSAPRDRLDHLRERLLRAGLSRRYVGRVVRELREHQVDLVEESLIAGRAPEEAEREAWRRLGGIASLAAAVIDADPRRAVVRSHPILAFTLMPLLLFPLVVIAIGGAAIGLHSAASAFAGPSAGDPAFIAAMISVMHALAWYGAAPLAAAACCEAARRHRCSWFWPLMSCLLLGALGGCFWLEYSLPTAGPGSGRVLVAFTSACSAARFILPLAAFAAWALFRPGDPASRRRTPVI